MIENCWTKPMTDQGKRRLVSPLQGVRVVCAAILVIGTVIAMASSSSAYVLKGVHVLDLMVTALAHAKTLQINQIVNILDPDVSDAPVSVTETISYAFPSRFRSDSQYELTSRISVASHGEHLTIIDGKWKAENNNRFDRYKDLLLFQSRPLLVKALLTYGVDVGTTSLGRFDDRIVYVIGANYPDTSRPQIWVDKERFLPVRWIDVVRNDPASTIEFVYKNWYKHNDQWYPKQIDTHYHGRLFRTIKVDKIIIDPALSNDLWNIDQLKNIYLPEDSGSVEDADIDTVDELQEAIESFQKKFEP